MRHSPGLPAFGMGTCEARVALEVPSRVLKELGVNINLAGWLADFTLPSAHRKRPPPDARNAGDPIGGVRI